MRQPPPISIGLALGLLLTALSTAPLGARDDPDELKYQDREDRYEGTLDWRESAGEGLTLLSARVYDPDEMRQWPDRLRLAFYLPEADGTHLAEPRVSITVRELEPGTTFYWLDQVRTPTPWRPGELNGFAWPTDVLRKLGNMVSIDDLGTVVRLRGAEPVREWVAPSFLDHPLAPRQASEYRFTLKPSVHALVDYRVEHHGTTVKSWPRLSRKKDQKLIVRWHSVGQPEGWYRLVVEGKPDLGGARFSKEILFYHHPTLGAGGGPDQRVSGPP